MVLGLDRLMDPFVDAPREIELKFEIDPQDLEKVRALATLQGSDGGVRQLESAYFDTDDRRLRGAGLALRVRHDGARRVQTVKTYDGAGLFDRGEWECEIGGDAPDLGAVKRTPAGAVLNGDIETLKPLFATRFRRTIRTLKARYSEIELALDEGEVDTGARQAPLLEIELELKRGKPAALFAAARKLSKSAILNLNFVGKAERGYILADGETARPQKSLILTLPAEATAAEAFRRIGRACLGQLTENARILRRTRSLDALHQMRVGLRRLRAALSIFKAVTADESREAIKAELKWLTGELGPARSLDVFLAETYQPAAARDPDRPGMAELGMALLAAQALAYERAMVATASARFRALVLETAAWIETGKWGERGVARNQPVKAFAEAALTRLCRKVKTHGRHLARLDPESRHRFRIEAKKLRYGVEFFGGLYADGKWARRRDRFALALKAMQDALGVLNDIATARQTAVEAARDVSPLALFAAGLVVGERAPEMDKRLREAAKLHAGLMEAKPFW